MIGTGLDQMITGSEGTTVLIKNAFVSSTVPSARSRAPTMSVLS